MQTTHTTHANHTSRFNRHNLPPNTAAALVVVSEDLEILAVVSAAARFTSDFGSTEKFDQLFESQHGNDANVPAPCVSKPITVDAHRTTIVFNDNAFTKRIGAMKEGRCWAQIVMEGRAGTQLRPRVTWQPLTENTWRPLPEVATKFPLPALGECWPMDSQITDYAAVNDNAWHLFVTAAVVIGGMPPMSFPPITAAAPTELNFLQQRDARIRHERQASRAQRMLEKLPPEMRESFLAKLAKAAQ